MRIKTLALLKLICLLFVGVVVSSCGQKSVENTPESDQALLSYASPYSQTHPFSRADIIWMDYIRTRSDGNIRIEPIWAGALLSSDMSMDELRHGVADIGLITPIYAAGGAHLLRSQTGFYSGVDNIGDQIALYRCLQASSVDIQREIKGLKILAVQGGDLPGFLMRTKPIRTLDDVKGMDIRVPNELVEVMQELGANPLSMSMGDVYSALAKGVIDGVVAPEDTLKSLHFAEVSKYYSRLKIPRGAYPARAISERSWNQLSKHNQDILTSSTPVWEKAMIDEILKAKIRGVEFGQEKNIEFITMSASDQIRFDDLYRKLAQENARKLKRYNIDGESVFNDAVLNITQMNARVLNLEDGAPRPAFKCADKNISSNKDLK